MASLQLRGESWSCIFYYQNKRCWLHLGEMPEVDAKAKKTRVEYLLRLIKQRLMTVPAGYDIVKWMEDDGKTVEEPLPIKDVITLAALRDQYTRVHSNSLEKTTLDGIAQHFKHWVSILGANFPMQKLSLADLQKYADHRAVKKGLNGQITAATIKKEIVTLRTVWNWAVQFDLVIGRFPMKGLRYPRSDEKLPFMTADEIEARIAAGGKADLWECLYLRKNEITDLLDYVKVKTVHPWIYPFFCFAAYTGARRSEIIRCQVGDVDFASNTITIREKKRVRGKNSTRRAPMPPFLREVLTAWLKLHPGGPNLFCQSGVIGRSRKRSVLTGFKGTKTRAKTAKGRAEGVSQREQQAQTPLTRNEVRDHAERALIGSKWENIKGMHVFRHSYISALANAGVDQRIIQDICGHMTAEMQQRYAHLYPSTKNDAVFRVFN
jgi:integrase